MIYIKNIHLKAIFELAKTKIMFYSNQWPTCQDIRYYQIEYQPLALFRNPQFIIFLLLLGHFPGVGWGGVGGVTYWLMVYGDAIRFEGAFSSFLA